MCGAAGLFRLRAWRMAVIGTPPWAHADSQLIREMRIAIKARREAVSGELASPSPPQPPRLGALFGEIAAEIEAPREIEPASPRRLRSA